MTNLAPQLIDRRAAVVREHIAAEDAHDVRRTLKTFHTPHYNVRPLGAETAGGPAVAELPRHAGGANDRDASRAVGGGPGERKADRRADLLHLPLRRGLAQIGVK